MTDDAVLDKLVAPRSAAPTRSRRCRSCPLIQVAWADGTIQDNERTAILQGAHGKGLEQGTDGYELLQTWLAKQPDDELFVAWEAYIKALAAQLNDEQNRLLKNQIVGFAKMVAASAGGILGFGKVSASEEKVLAPHRSRVRAVSAMNWLGKTGVKVSRIALGTMSFGGDADEATAGAIWRAARDAGVNFIDTADVYNEGRSEEIVGRLMRGERDDDRARDARRTSRRATDANARGTSRYHLVRAVEASLRRLATDRIDLYYLHRFDDVTDSRRDAARRRRSRSRRQDPLSGVLELRGLAGRARARHRSAPHGCAPFVAIQPMYNLVKRQVEVEILPMARALGVAVDPVQPDRRRPVHRQVRRRPDAPARPARSTTRCTRRATRSGSLRDRRTIHRARRRARPPSR